MKVNSLTLASVIAAIVASVCCIGPIVAVGLGLSAAGLAAAFEPLRPYFLGLTFIILGFAFYRAYHRPEENCAAGVCEKPASRRAQMLVLWLGAAIVVLFAAFPYYSGTVWTTLGPRFQAFAASTAEANSLAVLAVDDLNCGGCAAAIQQTLSRLDGIRDVKFNYNDNTASVLFDGKRVSAQQIEDRVKAAGVNVVAVRSNG
jgi:copper chaperone CopZ